MYYFGKPITLELANSQVSEYLALKHSAATTQAFENIASGSREAAYYKSGDLSFVFGKSVIEQMFKTPFCDGLRIYFGGLNKAESRVMSEGQAPVDLPAGTPTLVLVPCNIQPDGTVKNLVQETEQSLVACEHPGLLPLTGGNTGSFDLRTD